jgi:hypothetical protein
MPLTKKGKRVLRAVRKTYGKAKGTRVFYAMERLGKLKGLVRKKTVRKRKEER